MDEFDSRLLSHLERLQTVIEEKRWHLDTTLRESLDRWRQDMLKDWDRQAEIVEFLLSELGTFVLQRNELRESGRLRAWSVSPGTEPEAREDACDVLTEGFVEYMTRLEIQLASDIVAKKESPLRDLINKATVMKLYPKNAKEVADVVCTSTIKMREDLRTKAVVVNREERINLATRFTNLVARLKQLLK